MSPKKVLQRLQSNGLDLLPLQLLYCACACRMTIELSARYADTKSHKSANTESHKAIQKRAVNP